MADQRTTDGPSTGIGTQAAGSDDGKAEQAKQVVRQAADHAGSVAGQATEQAKEVARDTAEQAREVVRRGREHLDEEAQRRSQQAAGGLRTVADQLDALMHGRHEDAGRLPDYVRQGQQSAARLADRLDQGPTAVLDDVRRFARRQPVVFLAAAGTLGFVVGRLVRAARDASDGSSDAGASGMYGAEALPPPVPVADASAGVLPSEATTVVSPATPMASPPDGLAR